MGLPSIVSGYITISDDNNMEQTRQTIAAYPFDSLFPFTNIFWCDSPKHYYVGVVGFGGSYKQVEEVWSEWLWKFSQLLPKLEARDARVTLDCSLGTHSWRLLPRSWYDRYRSYAEYQANPQGHGPRVWIPDSTIGEPWGIVEAPENDFSIDPEWLTQVEESIQVRDEATGEWVHYKWDKFVERWPLPK